MPKVYMDDIWFQDGKGTIDIGFTQLFIDRMMGECYHITQASAVLMTKDRAMLTIETNEGLKVIRSPVTGTVAYFNTHARDFPDRLTEDSVVISIKPKPVVVAAEKVKGVTKKYPTVQWGHLTGNQANLFVIDDNNNNNNDLEEL